MADGGEGTGEAIHDALAGRWVTLVVRDPIGRTVESATPGSSALAVAGWPCWSNASG